MKTPGEMSSSIQWFKNEVSPRFQPNFAAVVAGPIAITMSAGCFSSAGQITVWGDNTSGQTNAPPNLTNVVALAAGDAPLPGLENRRDGGCLGRKLLGSDKRPNRFDKCC